MTELERLKEIEREKDELADVVQTGIKEGYEQLVRTALQRNNFNMDLVKKISISVSSVFNNSNSIWEEDSISVNIGNDKDYYTLDIYIKPNVVKFNNCCSGNWTFDSMYYQYVKMMSILAFELNQSLLGYAQAVDRQPLKEADEARWAVDREEQRIRNEEQKRIKEAKIQEIDNAEYIGCYTRLRWYEDDYVEGNDNYRLSQLYKVVRRTPKRLYVQQYLRNQYDGDPEDLYKPCRWYRDEEILKKEDLYNPNWKAITKDMVNIED